MRVRGGRLRAAGRAGFRVGLLGALLAAGALPAPGKVFLTQEEALALVFAPGEPVERRTLFLTEPEAEWVGAVSGEPMESRVVTYYAGTRADGGGATAFFDTHRVRTLPETLMIAVDPQGRVLRVAVLSFQEPADYLPRPKWFEQFPGRVLDDSLAPRRGIHGVTGATLTSRAVTRAVRRTLALHDLLAGNGPDREGRDGRGAR